MATVSQIIEKAFREVNLVGELMNPTPTQAREALEKLQVIVSSVLGNEVGDPLTAFPIGNNNIQRPAGYPWWNTVPDNDWFVPKNTRVMLNLNSPGINLYLHPDPDDGSRFAANDVSKTLSTYPVIVYGNGRTIEDSDTISLNTDGFEGEWLYRQDLGNWLKVVPLQPDDPFPFPTDFDDFFITFLAIRLSPAYEGKMSDLSLETFRKNRSKLNARYAQIIPTRSELALFRMPKVAADRDIWGNSYWLYNPNSMFDKGWPW